MTRTVFSWPWALLRALPFLVAALVVLTVFLLRLEGGVRHHLANSDAARARGEWSLAILHAREAAAAAPMPGAAGGYARLEEMADDAEARTDWETASAAALGTLDAARASRGVLFDNASWVAHARARMIDLGPSLSGASAQSRTRPPREAARAMNDLTTDSARRPWAAGLAGVLFAVFAAAAWRGFAKDRARPQAPAWAVWLGALAAALLLLVEATL